MSSLDPFIKVVADSNKGIILMPVLSDVKFSIPPGSVGSFLGNSSSSSLDQGVKDNVSNNTSYTPDKLSNAPHVSSIPHKSLSLPNFSSLSKVSSAARDAARNLTPSTSRSNIQDFNISFPSDNKNSAINISVTPKGQISYSKSGSEDDNRRDSVINAYSQEELAKSSTPRQGSVIGNQEYDIRYDDLSRAPSSDVKGSDAAAESLQNLRQENVEQPSPPSPQLYNQ